MCSLMVRCWFFGSVVIVLCSVVIMVVILVSCSICSIFGLVRFGMGMLMCVSVVCLIFLLC